jgi:hypothetical protein
MSNNFDDRLREAIGRGQERSAAAARVSAARALTEDEYRRLHSTLRLALSEHIEACLKRLPNHFPGFQYETMYGDRGWGGACSRDDLVLARGSRSSNYSRLEITIRPYSPLHVLELAGKGTIRNREVFNRTYFEELPGVDEQKFRGLVDVWVLEYAELYSAKTP